MPPTVNHLYRSTAVGRRYKTEAGRQYQQEVNNIIKQAYSGKEVYTGSVGLYIVFETNTRRRWDIDNRVKALQDCLTMAGVLRDDKQVDMLCVERRHTDCSKTHVTLLKL